MEIGGFESNFIYLIDHLWYSMLSMSIIQEHTECSFKIPFLGGIILICFAKKATH